MDPCPFVRIVISNLALIFPNQDTNFSSFVSKFKLKGSPFPAQSSDLSILSSQNDVVEPKNHCFFTLSKTEFEKAVKTLSLKVEVHKKVKGSCGVMERLKLLGSFVINLDLKAVFENNNGRSVVQNGWVEIGKGKLHLTVRAEPDPRFVFRFDGEPECSPQVFQVNGNVKQPVFTLKFEMRNFGERNLRSRSSLSEPSTSSSCFTSSTSDSEKPSKERKGWSITVHDLSGSPVAAASMVTPFVPSHGTDKVGKANPGAWLILRPSQSTWKPWGRLEAWRDGDRIGHRIELIPDGGIDSIPLANSNISVKNGGKLSIDVTNGPTPLTSPNGSFDLSSGTGSGSGSDLGSASGSGSWANLLYRGFVMSSTVKGNGKCSKPEVEVGVQHVSCTEDAAAFVALAAAMDLSMDACRLFSQKLRKELRKPDLS